MQTRRSSIGIRWFKLSLRNQICFLFSNFREHWNHPICSLIVEDIARIGRFLPSGERYRCLRQERIIKARDSAMLAT